MYPQTPTDPQPNAGKPHGEEAGGRKAPRWRLGTRIAFRFAFVYFLLYTLDIPFHFFPFPPSSQIASAYDSLFAKMVPWVSKSLLHLQHDFSLDYLNTGAGSKDTTYAYVQALCYFVIAILATVVWSLLDRKRANYEWLHNWFRVYLRLVIATTMLVYGAVKIFPWQFPPLSLSKLVETYGDSSPMGLLWTFMGASRTYSLFAGSTELLGGLLLVIPRLATLGVLVCIGALTNVFMLNVGYDVPVKLNLINLLLMLLFLVLPELQRLVDFFVLNRRVEAPVGRPLFRRKWLNWTAIALQVAFGVVVMSYNLYQAHHKATHLIESSLNTPLYGIWLVDEFTFNGQVLPPLLTDTVRWQRVIIENSTAVVLLMTNQPAYYNLQFNPQKSRMRLIKFHEWGSKGELSYQSSPSGRLTLTGELEGHPVNITLHRLDEFQFLLNKRGFQWVEDFAVNQ